LKPFLDKTLSLITDDTLKKLKSKTGESKIGLPQENGCTDSVDMDGGIFVTSIAIGAAIFAGLVIFWFFNAFIKRRLGTDQPAQLATTSQKSKWEEKRQHPRVPISWPVELEPPYESLRIRLKDISRGGAFIICQKPLPLNEKLRLCIKLPEQEELLLNAEVVWSNTNVPRDQVIHRGMGVKFAQNTKKACQRLENAISILLKT
jgi:Tfp pilus assembly protein PilZ